MTKHALIIFTRNPELGKCKTRLAKTIGDHATLEVYQFLLSHTNHVCSQMNVDRFVFYSDHIEENDIWDTNIYNKKIQEGIDLGARMSNAFKAMFDQCYSKVVIIGSDLLDLNTSHLNNAYSKLDDHEVVIGPAHDGGYYLIGLKRSLPELFQNKKWGTSTVLQNTLEDLQHHKVGLLEELNDIDTFEDMKSYPELKSFYLAHD